MSFLWTKQIIKISKMSSMHQDIHWQYYVNFLKSKYISYHRKNHARNWQNEISINGFSQFLYQYISNISNLYNLNKNLSLESQMKCDNMFLDPIRIRVFFFFFSYVLGLYFYFSYVVIVTIEVNVTYLVLRRCEGVVHRKTLVLEYSLP